MELRIRELCAVSCTRRLTFFVLFFQVPGDVNVLEIAGISSNPSTAYRMLKDFVPLEAGDVVIQNGANSACGQNVIQLCRIKKFVSVNVVRDRADIEQLKAYLQSLGANYVFTEEELRLYRNFVLIFSLRKGGAVDLLRGNCIAMVKKICTIYTKKLVADYETFISILLFHIVILDK